MVSGWQDTEASELGDFEESLIIIFNDGVGNMVYQVEACADINDPDWYMWPSGALIAGSGFFTSLQWPWGAVKLRLHPNPNVTHATVWVNTRLRT